MPEYRFYKGPKEEQEEAKCREFVDLLNRNVSNSLRYHYMGLTRELTGGEFPDCMIKDRQTGQELGVELTRMALDWLPAERATMELLSKRLAYSLIGSDYEKFQIFLQTRDFTKHPLANPTSSLIPDLVRVGKRFFIEKRDWLIQRLNGSVFLDEFQESYPPFAKVFGALIVALLPDGYMGRVDDLAPAINIGATAWEHPETEARAEEAFASKLRGSAYKTDLLLIHGDGPVTMSVDMLLGSLKRAAQKLRAADSFKELWYLSPAWSNNEKLFRIL